MTDSIELQSEIRPKTVQVFKLSGIQPREVDTFRLDLETSYRSNTLIRHGDLEATLFSLLLASHSLAAYVRGALKPPDPAVDPFRALHQHALRIISELDAYTSSLHDPDLAAARRFEGKEAEGPRDVGW